MDFKKFFILITLTILICLSLYAGKILQLDSLAPFSIYNKNNGKIYDYYLLKAGENVELEFSNSEKLDFYTRLLFDQEIKDSKNYQYTITLNDSVKKIIKKKSGTSGVSKGLQGQTVSTYDKASVILREKTKNITINNPSEYDILLKIIDVEGSQKEEKEFEFVTFPIQNYSDKLVLNIEGKDYTYYSPGQDSISFTLQGPFELKIFSRVVFSPDEISDNKRYRFRLYDNDKLFSEFNEVAEKSSRTSVYNIQEKIPSTADVNLIKIDHGLHEIEIKNPDINREIIFGIYLNKIDE
ncbi:MAG: hypothetical protein KGY75_04455 [Candidatus Cloacimonetes bacterium]|nr:hypothetical protein [Candidatus Cloacimonadota bacterium]